MVNSQNEKICKRGIHWIKACLHFKIIVESGGSSDSDENDDSDESDESFSIKTVRHRQNHHQTHRIHPSQNYRNLPEDHQEMHPWILF